MSYPGPAQINAGEWNAPLFYNSGTDLRACASLWMLGIRPDGSLFGGRCYLGHGNVWLNNQTMLENNWTVYMIQDGDLPMAGWYTVELWAFPEPPVGQLEQSTFQVGQ